jgi:hypothetical protein
MINNVGMTLLRFLLAQTVERSQPPDNICAIQADNAAVRKALL